MAIATNSWIKRIVVAAVAIAVFYGVKELKQSWFDQRAIAKVDNTVNQLREEAIRANPEAPAEAMKEAAGKHMAEQLASQSGDKAKQASTAADQFWGFFLVNTRTRFDYCKEQGVDISSFVKAFERIHGKEVARASAIYAREGADIDKIYGMLKVTNRKVIEDDMQGMAKTHNTNLREVCRAFAENGQEIADEMQLSKAHPVLHQVLLRDH